METSRKRRPSPSRDAYTAKDTPLAKRFRTLSLRGRLLNRVTKPQSPRHRSPSPSPGKSHGASQFMEIDDSPNKVYVYNLDSSDSEGEDNGGDARLTFLPDIEKQLTKIPLSILQPGKDSQTSTELVLYREPTSLTVAEEDDGVRKFVLEHKERARQRQADEQRAREVAKMESLENIDTSEDAGYDPDAMDLG